MKTWYSEVSGSDLIRVIEEQTIASIVIRAVSLIVNAQARTR